jgi:hypothetical protein
VIVEYGTTTLRGVIDGNNKIFELANTPVVASMLVYQNGICLDPNYDNGWYMDGPSLLSFAEPPDVGDTVIVAYDPAPPVVVPPAIPQPTPPAPVYPPLGPSEYGLAQSNYPPGGVASLLSPTIIGSTIFGLLGGTTTQAAVLSLAPHIVQTQVF